MKRLAILFAVIGLAFNVAVAENVKPVAKANVKVEHNGFNLIKIDVEKKGEGKVNVEIYDSGLTLLHTERMRKTNSTVFDISKLNAGDYILKVTADKEMVYTQTIKKIK